MAIPSKKWNDKLMEQVTSALIHNVGDHRQCPRCGHTFVPEDATQTKTLEVYKEMVSHNA